MTVLIGTSGWMYRDWRERFYPKGVPQRVWLEHYAERFVTVESNNAFYMLPKPETFKSWAERTPDDFVMAVKVNRYITHIRRLRDCAEPAARFLEHCRHLGSKLGPILLQLPPNLKANLEDLGATLDALGPGRVAVEFRHETWFTDETRAVLEERNVALCMADRDSRPISPTWRRRGLVRLLQQRSGRVRVTRRPDLRGFGAPGRARPHAGARGDDRRRLTLGDSSGRQGGWDRSWWVPLRGPTSRC